MYVAYRAWGLEYPWPNDLVWNSLSVHLDDFQTWLLTERGKEDQSLVFTIFEGFSSAIDHLVEWFNRLLIWMTWAGTTIAGVALVSALRRSARSADGPCRRSRPSHCSASGRRAWRRWP